MLWLNEEALEWLRWAMSKMGLGLNEEKTRLCDGRRESFRFLGYELEPEIHHRTGNRYLAAQPSAKLGANTRCCAIACTKSYACAR